MQVELVERNLESFQNIIYGSEQDSYHTDRLGNRYSNNYDGQRWGNVLGTDVNDLIYTQSNRSFHYSNANAARSYLTTKGGTGHDRIRAGEGIDYLYGEDGNDEIYAGNNSMDKLYGGADRDTLSGGYLQEGGTGNDTLIEGLGMYGNEGEDTLIGGLRDSGSRMWGGEGRDKFIYNEPDGGVEFKITLELIELLSKTLLIQVIKLFTILTVEIVAIEKLNGRSTMIK